MADGVSTGYAPVGGIELYWESRGEGGVPLIVVHGGYGRTTMFGGLLDELAATRRVIAIELQGHGHTKDTDRPFSWAGFADDIGGLIRHLGLDQADLLGYSLGGEASLRATIQSPDLIRRLALISVPCRRDGWFPDSRAGFDQMNHTTTGFLRQTPVYEAWAAVAPDLSAFDALIDKTGELLREPFDWSTEVAAFTQPALLVYADADAIPTSHAAEFFGLLGGGLRDAGPDGSAAPASKLAILPGRTHYDILGAPGLTRILDDFLS